MTGRNGWPFRIVIVGDKVEIRVSMRSILEEHMDMAVVGETASGPGALELIRLLSPDVVVIGPSPGRGRAVSTIQAIHQERPSTTIITVRLTYSLEERVAFVKAGALSLLEYPERGQLPSSIRRADHIQQEIRGLD